jgi:hypothetical protein
MARSGGGVAVAVVTVVAAMGFVAGCSDNGGGATPPGPNEPPINDAVASTSASPTPSVDETTTTSAVGAELVEVARSQTFGLAPLWDLDAGEDGEVWASVLGEGIFRFDEAMAESLTHNSLDAAAGSWDEVEFDAGGTVYARARMPGPYVDGHGEAEAMSVLVRILASGEEQIVHSFEDIAGLGFLEVAGTDAITAFGVGVTVVDLETGAVRAETELDAPAISMTVTDKAVWVATTSRAVFSLDRETLDVLDRRDGLDHFKQLASIDDAVWAIVDGEVIAVSDSALAVPESNERFLGQQASDGRLWLVTRDALIVFSGDDGAEIARASLEPGHTSGVLEVSGRTAWLEDGTTNEIVRYELSP